MYGVGIVCEYNPFHTGHLYHMEQSRQLYEDAVIICCMSGDFVQRGEAAVMSKYARAEAACRCGADVVFELPLPWCLSSAETYARGAVSILAAAGCKGLSFGAESERQEDLVDLASCLLEEKTKRRILSLMRTNDSLSYVKARQNILRECCGEKALLALQPNNILAIEYLKVLSEAYPEIRPCVITRQGAEHDSMSMDTMLSAKMLRSMLQKGKRIEHYLPPASMEILDRESNAGRISSPVAMEPLIRSRLYQVREEEFDLLPDAGDGAGRRLYHMLREGRTLNETVELATTKRYTMARMRRILLSAVLDIRAEHTKSLPPYIRLLACNEKGRAYLAKEKKKMELPLITKPAMVKKLDHDAMEIFSLGSSAHDLFMLQNFHNQGISLGEDWKTGPFIV